MPGLLNNLGANVPFNVGMGLLSQGPSRGPINPWQGVQQGLLAAQQNQAWQAQQQQQNEYMRLRQEQLLAQQQAAQQKAYEDAMARARQDAADKYLSEGDASAALRVLNPEKFAEKQLEPPEKGTSTQQEYEQAIAQGFKGTLLDYKRALAEAGRSTTNINNVMGGQPDRVLTPEEAPAYGVDPANAGKYLVDFKGGLKLIPKTAGEKKVEEIDAKESAATEKARAPISDYQKAVATWRDSPTSPEAIAAMQQERRRLAQTLAQARNPGRAPTDADVEVAMQDIPMPTSAMDLAAKFTGGDPWAAKMNVLAKELGVGLSPPSSTESSGEWGDLKVSE